jgi:hypothetical protein
MEKTATQPSQGQNTTTDPNIAKLGRWNWGAFLLNFIWGIGNNVPRALFCFIPIFGFIWMFVLGFKGNEWAYKGGHWHNLAHFKRTQRKWAIAGVISWLSIAGIIYLVFHILIHMFINSAISQQSFTLIQKNAQVQTALGMPITRADSVTKGEISTASSHIIYSVTGSKNQGSVRADGIKNNDSWVMTYLAVTPNDGQKIVLIDKSKQSHLLPAQTKDNQKPR